MEADTRITSPGTRNLNAVSQIIDKLVENIGKFADPNMLPKDTPGLQKNGVVVLYQDPGKRKRRDGTIEDHVHLVRFRFVTPDGLDTMADFDFDFLNGYGRTYIIEWFAEVGARLMERREERKKQLPPEISVQTTSAVERAVSQAAAAKATGGLN